jgi:hypothetical protein
MPGFWESLGQGLETAGGILSPDVYGSNQNARTAALQRAQQNQQLSAKAIMEGIQNGSIDPAMGQQALSRIGFGNVPVGPSMEAQLNRQALDYFGGGQGGGAPQAGLGGPGGLQPGAGDAQGGPMPPGVAMSPFGQRYTQQRAAEALIAQRNRPRMSINVDNYTPDSVATFRQSGNYADLVPKEKPGQDTPFLKELRAANIDPMSPEGQRYLKRRLDKETAPTAGTPTDTPLGSDPEFWYEYYRKTKTLPPISWGTAGNPTRQAFIEGFPKWMKAHGYTAEGGAASTAASQAEFHADAGALNAVTKDLNTFEPYKKMLDVNADIAITLGRKITQTDARLANHTVNWFRQNASSNPDVAEYLAQMHFVTVEGARVINNPRIVGQLTNESKAEMHDVITGDAPIAVVDRVLNRMKADGSNRFDAMRSQQGEIMAKMKGGAATTDPLVYKGYRFPTKEALDKFKADGG